MDPRRQTAQIRPIRITNSLTRKKETLQTLEPGRLTMYSCGPTVYNLIHIGNLRAALTADLFYRYFQRVGFQVTYVRNYTDVDDKIIKRANEEGVSCDVITQKYIQEVEKDFILAGLKEPSIKPRVTAHIVEIIAMIEEIIQHGQAYVVDGEVLFSIEAFKSYGKLSHKKIDDLQAGARVEVDQKKHNPLDFALWKPAKPGEPSWNSPWGKGRPGWHIECSAMSRCCLGNQIDLHHGGEDLIFPHHENEIAQSESATGKVPFARYWLHNAFLNINSEKMSKSLGNFFLARDFLAKYGAEVARYLLLSSHYRSTIDFNEEALSQALTSLERIYDAKEKALALTSVRRDLADLRAEQLWGEFVAGVEKARGQMDEAFANDFNTPDALAALFSVIREWNRVLAEPKAQGTPAAILGAQALLNLIEKDLGGILGFGIASPNVMKAKLSEIRAGRLSEAGLARPTAEEIEAAIAERLGARRQRDFAKADLIRKTLESRGVLLKDDPKGTTWRYR